MKYALFLGCQIPARVEHYEISTREVLKQLDISLIDIRQFNCCGYPVRNQDQMAFLLSSVRNLALAERSGLDILVLCKCCYGSLKKAEHFMRESGELQNKLQRILEKEDLYYQGTTKIRHLLSVLHGDVGLKTLNEKIQNKYHDLQIATHYGCHALRPSTITEFDDPVAPTLFDDLVTVTGAKSIDWQDKLECCGAPLLGTNDELSLKLTQRKITAAKNAGADFLCTACPYCQIQFDSIQQQIVKNGSHNEILKSILFP